MNNLSVFGSPQLSHQNKDIIYSHILVFCPKAFIFSEIVSCRSNTKTQRKEFVLYCVFFHSFFLFPPSTGAIVFVLVSGALSGFQVSPGALLPVE